jgi:hypothetical protein
MGSRYWWDEIRVQLYIDLAKLEPDIFHRTGDALLWITSGNGATKGIAFCLNLADFLLFCGHCYLPLELI